MPDGPAMLLLVLNGHGSQVCSVYPEKARECVLYNKDPHG